MEQGKKGIMDKIERWKILADLLLKEDKRVFIKDIDDNWYFADILLVGEETLTIQCFAPEDRTGEKIVLYWALIKLFEEYKK